jgi:hypothetical protein
MWEKQRQSRERSSFLFSPISFLLFNSIFHFSSFFFRFSPFSSFCLHFQFFGRTIWREHRSRAWGWEEEEVKEEKRKRRNEERKRRRRGREGMKRERGGEEKEEGGVEKCLFDGFSTKRETDVDGGS